MNLPVKAKDHGTRIRRWTAFTPPQSTALAALCGLFVLRRSYMAYNGVTIRAGKVGPVRYSLSVKTAPLKWEALPNGDLQSSISVTAVSFSPKGKVLSHTVREVVLTNQAEFVEKAQNASIFSLQLDTPPGTANLRFIVRDGATGRIGTVDLKQP